MEKSRNVAKNGVTERLVNYVISHSKLVVVAWIIAILALTPVIMTYSNYVSYSSSTSGSSGYESTIAGNILSKVNPQNSSLVVVVDHPSAYNLTLANATLDFQNNLVNSGTPYVMGSISAFSEYAIFLNAVLKPYSMSINSTVENVKNLSGSIYSFPALFYYNWASYSYESNQILAAANASGYVNSTEQYTFLNYLNESLAANAALGPEFNVNNATFRTALELYGYNSLTQYVLKYQGLSNYTAKSYLTASRFISAVSGVPVSEKMVYSVVSSSAPGFFFVRHYGLTGAPAFILRQFVSPDNTTYLVNVVLNVSSSYRGSNNFYPAQSIVPQVRNMTTEYFGQEGSVTGNGAVSYDLQNSQGNSFIGFILTFVFLAIIVGLVLRSYISPVLALILVSISTVLGYVAIFLVGFSYHPVNYIVTYTLTAVLLGVSTDYFLFILSRFREEIATGKPMDEAIRTAASKSGVAVVVSGLTVATSLGTMSFVTGLNTWGPVLFLAVIFTVLAEITFVPAVAALLGKRLFRGIRQKEFSKSAFYRVGKFAARRKYAVVAAILITAAPAVYFWFETPVSYDISGELPSSLPSVQALNTVNQKFGESALFPAFVIANFSSSAFVNGSITQSAYDQVKEYQAYIESTGGVTSVIGPEPANGTVLNPTFFFNGNRSVYFIVELKYSPYSQNAINTVQHLRDNSAFIVGGITSGVIDLKNTTNTEYSLLEILIVAAIGVIIGLSFRSIKFPVIALSGVFISISWTLGILYAIVHYLLNESLIFLIPVILFIILMSLGNDFTVFLISRINEEQKAHGHDEGLFRGMAGSGSVVTALGIILAASLGSLGLVPIAFLQQMGLAFAISLVIDTFIIRTFYFPSMISIMKRREEVQTRKS